MQAGRGEVKKKKFSRKGNETLEQKINHRQKIFQNRSQGAPKDPAFIKSR